jgi:hypothetical protein
MLAYQYDFFSYLKSTNDAIELLIPENIAYID